MAVDRECTILDANGALVRVALLPPWGQSIAERSMPLVLASDVGLPPCTAIAPGYSTALEASHIIKGSSGRLFSLSVSIGASSGILMLFDQTLVPGNGPVTPVWSRRVPSEGGAGSYSVPIKVPFYFASGIVVVFSTDVDPFTKAGSNTASFSWQAL